MAMLEGGRSVMQFETALAKASLDNVAGGIRRRPTTR